MSTRLFLGIINQMKKAVDRCIGIIDESGVIVSCSELEKIGETRQGIRDELAYSSDAVVSGGFTYRPLSGSEKNDYIVFVEGEDKKAEEISMLIAISLSNIKSLFDEKYDKATLIKNILLDNILPGDIYVKSKELHFPTDVMRVAILIRFLGKTDIIPYEVIQNMFPDKTKDFVVSVSEREVVLLKEVDPDCDIQEIELLAQQIADTVNAEFFTKVSIGIGSMVPFVQELARSYKEAQTAIEVGKIFDMEKKIVSYDNLGIARLIYQLPTTLCEMFLKEIFKKGSISGLDNETLFTIQKFFENNLNVSETSRKLFVHRNTLVYRLEKIKKLTGLDLREFDHAIVFKVALMVKKYLNSQNHA